MLANKMTLEVTINGKKYTIQGNYFPPYDGTYWQPPEPSEFDILLVKDENGNDLDDFLTEEDEYKVICDAADVKWHQEQEEYWKTYSNDLKNGEEY